jgi:hypothetical protein
VPTTGREIEFRSHCLDDGRNYIYLLSQLQHIYLHISGVILQNLDWLQLKFDFVSGTATINTEFSSGLKFPPISNKKDPYYRSIIDVKHTLLN